VHLNVGQELFSIGGRDDDAIRHLRRAAVLRSDWSEPHRCLGTVYQARGRPDAALRHLRTALQLEPGNADLHCLIGRCHLLACQYEDALASLRAALARRREHPVAAHLLGVAYESLGARRRALRAYRRAVTILPVYPPAVADLRRLERATASNRSA
jgi:Flp pilus assembly protein TadD